TTASVNGKNKDIRPQKEITLVDVLEYKNLKKGETYTAKGVLMDKVTGKPVLDPSGKQITAEQEFKTFMSNGKVKVTFTFDATSLYGKETVVFEKVYDSEGHVAATHEEIDDEGQTVTWEHMQPSYEMYKIRTTKAPSKGDKYGFFAKDEVEYEVHVENTGNIALTMDVTDQFTQNPEYFTVPKLKDVTFAGEGTWNNKGKDEFIANITLEPGEKAVVTYTAVISDDAKEYLAAAAKDSDSLDDKGHDINREYQKNKTDDHDGYWNTAYCDNVTYPNPDNPDEPGTLEPKDDVAQTPVQKPEIGTSLADGAGTKTVAAAKVSQLIDSITY
ncbi:MAG: VaFE repeat-containing surface-anchored protein, partial [Mogibacterium sp.]|nr:VaFE repeat-containing surface-anchored protein [Mogibacterium sp.]